VNTLFIIVVISIADPRVEPGRQHHPPAAGTPVRKSPPPPSALRGRTTTRGGSHHPRRQKGNRFAFSEKTRAVARARRRAPSRARFFTSLARARAGGRAGAEGRRAQIGDDKKKSVSLPERKRAPSRARFFASLARARAGGRVGAEGKGEGETHLQVVTA